MVFISEEQSVGVMSDNSSASAGVSTNVSGDCIVKEEGKVVQERQPISVSYDSDEAASSLSKMVSVLCEQQLYLPLLRAFEMFLPSCSLLSFIRALQVFELIHYPNATFSSHIIPTAFLTLTKSSTDVKLNCLLGIFSNAFS